MVPKRPEDSGEEKNSLLARLSEKFSRGMDEAGPTTIAKISTNTVIDWLLTGIPLSRFTTIFGPESSGKSTFALHMAAEFQKQGGTVLWLDAEASFDPNYASAIGVNMDPDKLLVLKQDLTIERCFEVLDSAIIELLERRNEEYPPLLIVWDSIAATPSQKELEMDYTEAPVALSARALSIGFRRISPKLAYNPKVAIMVVTQIRANLATTGWGAINYDLYGGHALKHYQALALEFRKRQTIKEDQTGVMSEIIIQKSKVFGAPLAKSILVTIMYGKGIDNARSVFEIAKALNYIKSSGGFWTINKDIVKNLLEEGEELGEIKNLRKDDMMELLLTEEHYNRIRRLWREKNLGESIS